MYVSKITCKRGTCSVVSSWVRIVLACSALLCLELVASLRVVYVVESMLSIQIPRSLAFSSMGQPLMFMLISGIFSFFSERKKVH